MGLFKGLTASKERQKAKAFYEKALHLTGNPREVRRIYHENSPMEFGCLFKQQKVLLVERMKLTSI